MWVPQPCSFQGAVVDLAFHCSFALTETIHPP